MRFAVNLPNFGDLADPCLMVELAVETERAGWDGFFVWDHIVIADAMPVGDPWVMLSAIGQATERLIIGPMVTPLPRRRPWVVARQTVTLDQLTGGRTVLGVGIGFPPEEEFGTFGEPTDERVRADMLDEGLAVLEGMWNGEPFAMSGEHYRIQPETTFAPAPMHGRVPIWVAGMWPHRRPLRRAAKFDGVFPIAADMSPLEPETVAEIVRYVTEHRDDGSPLDVVIGGSPDVDFGAYAEAGVTWYQVGPHEQMTAEQRWEMISGGPPATR